MAENNEINWKIAFLKEITTVKNKKKYKVFDQSAYNDIIKELEDAKKIPGKKTITQYRLLKRFAILEIAGVKKLIKKCEVSDEFKYFIPAEEVFDVIKSAHEKIGHGGRDRIIEEVNLKYANVTREAIYLFLSMCEICQKKKSKKKRGLVPKPIVHKQFNSRCQVDLIDFQTQAADDFKFLMVCQDHLTKFVVLRALKSKSAEDVAIQLKDIFSIFGAPCIFHTDNGREFKNQIIKALAMSWPEVKIVHGKPRHSQTQGSVERANRDIENMLAAWLKDNPEKKWPQGLANIQISKNRTYHSGIKMLPYRAMFGINFRAGLTSTSLANEVLDKIEVDILDEQQLEELLKMEIEDLDSDEVS